jgi:hypothetical protein
VGGYQEIVSTNHGSTRLEAGANLSIVESGLIGILQNLDVPQIDIQGSLVFFPAT